MGTLGTFDSFTTARLGIYAAQQGLQVTGNNISNINTSGYTRQRVDQVSFKTGANDMYRSHFDNHIGSGALITGISQIRDPFLDIRYRNTASETAYSDTMLNGLKEIASILDEVGKGENKGDGMLYAQIQDIYKSLEQLSVNPTKENDTLVRSAAESLTTLFHTYAGKLETLRKNTEEDFTKQVKSVNEILTNIRDLNKQIRDCDINGDPALELRDERNRQIDSLSEYMHIRVEYTMEDIVGGIQVEKLTISLGDSNPDPTVETDSAVLVDGLYATQLSIPKERPKLNTSDDPALQGYLYTKEVPLYEKEPDGSYTLDPNGDKIPVYKEDPNNPGNPLLDDDGKPIQDTEIVGTNDPAAEGIITEPNDNYSIQLSKLLNSKGAEWKSSSTSWEDVSVKTPALAEYRVKLTTVLGDGDTFVINDINGNPTTYKVGVDIDADDAKDAAKLAEFIVGKLPANPDYDITSSGPYIVYTAAAGKEGVPGVDPNAPAAAPAPTITGDTTKLALGSVLRINPGFTYEQPNPLEPPEGTTTNPRTGTDVSVSYTQVEGRWYRVTIETRHTFETALDDNDLHGSLQAMRELLTEKGEFSTADDVSLDENATTKRGIPYYQKSLDLLARKFAESFNALNQGVAVDQDGNVINQRYEDATIDQLVESKVLVKPAEDSPYQYYVDAQGNFVGKYEQGVHDPCVLTDKVKLNVNDTPAEAIAKIDKANADGANITMPNGDPVTVDNYEDFLAEHCISADPNTTPGDTKVTIDAPIPMGGVLFSNRNDGDDPTGINASNIDIAHSWSVGDVQIVPKFEILFGGDVAHSTQNKNIDHMISLIDQALVYHPTDLDPDAVGSKLFTGSFNDMFSNMMTVEGNDQRITNIQLNNHYTSLVSLDSSREGVSGVDLNDEAMNMMQFQKAYSAACRLMTTIDEVLDRLINNTGIAGR